MIPQEQTGIELTQCQMMKLIRLISRLLLMSFSQKQNCECLLRQILLWFVLIVINDKVRDRLSLLTETLNPQIYPLGDRANYL